MEEEQRSEPRSLPIWVSLLVVLLCLGGGALFVRWYFQTPIAKRVVGDATTVSDAPRPRRPAPRDSGDVRQLSDLGKQKRWLVRAGWAQMRVNQSSGGQPEFSYVYSTHRFLPEEQQETWVMFLRLRSDGKTAEFIKLSPEQVKKLREISTSLDMVVSEADRKRLGDAWARYLVVPDPEKPAASEAVVRALHEAARAALEPSRKAMTERIARIRALVSDEQVKAFADMGR